MTDALLERIAVALETIAASTEHTYPVWARVIDSRVIAILQNGEPVGALVRVSLSISALAKVQAFDLYVKHPTSNSLTAVGRATLARFGRAMGANGRYEHHELIGRTFFIHLHGARIGEIEQTFGEWSAIPQGDDVTNEDFDAAVVEWIRNGLESGRIAAERDERRAALFETIAAPPAPLAADR